MSAAYSARIKLTDLICADSMSQSALTDAYLDVICPKPSKFANDRNRQCRVVRIERSMALIAPGGLLIPEVGGVLEQIMESYSELVEERHSILLHAAYSIMRVIG